MNKCFYLNFKIQKAAATLLLVTLITPQVYSQKSIDDALKKFNQETVPYITTNELSQNFDNYLLLDTRKKEEYNVSHLPNAVWIGEQLDTIAFAKAQPDKKTPIVVYCSIGVRSEDLGEQLIKLGYKNTYNLYGSIFAWKNAELPIINQKNKHTDSVHVFSKSWGKYLTKGVKIY